MLKPFFENFRLVRLMSRALWNIQTRSRACKWRCQTISLLTRGMVFCLSCLLSWVVVRGW